MKPKQNRKTLTMYMMALCILALVLGSSSIANAGDKKLDLEICAPGQDFILDIDNPYILYYPVGKQSTLIGEEDDETD